MGDNFGFGSGIPDDEDELRPRIGRPNLASSTPPLTLRGVGTRQPGDVFGQGSKTPEQISASIPSAQRLGDESELQRRETTGSGISQIQHGSPEGGIGIAKPHRFLGGILRGLNTVGTIAGAVSPLAHNIMTAIPGTEEHHSSLVNQSRGRIGEDVAQEKEEAVTANQNSEAQARQNPRAKNEFELWQQQNPNGTLDQYEGALNKPAKDEDITKAYGQALLDGDMSRAAALEPRVTQFLKTTQKPQADKPDTATEEKQRAETIRQNQILGKPVSSEDAAWLKAHTTESTMGPAATATFNAPKAESGRADKSYQLQSGRLDKIRQPIDQIIQRVGRLNDTLDQKSPQGDALVAPELLSIMSGGQGSGLRMNEAEIARIVGGRSAWESLKASAQHWSTDPSSARSITADQDKQIRALVGAVHTKLASKQKIMDDAEEALLASDDPKEHRQIVVDARKKLDAIDAGGQSNGHTQEVTATGPGGHKIALRDERWVDAATGNPIQ